MAGKFTPIKETYVKRRAQCAAQRKAAQEAKAKRSTELPACTALELARRRLIMGAQAYLKRLKEQDPAFRSPLVLTAAGDIINTVFAVDEGSGPGMARLFEDLLNDLTLGQLSAAEVTNTFELLKNQDVRKRLKERIDAEGAAAPEQLRQLSTQNEPQIRDFFAAFVALELKWRTKVVRWALEADPNFRYKLYGYLSSNKAIRVLVRRAPQSSGLSAVALRELTNSFVALLAARTSEGPYVPDYVEGDWLEAVKAAVQECKHPTHQSCDLVLALCTETSSSGKNQPRCGGTPSDGAVDTEELHAVADLRFVHEEASPTLTVPGSGGPPEVRILVREPNGTAKPDDVLAFDAQNAAERLLVLLAPRIDIMGDPQPRMLIRVAPPRHSGVSVAGQPICLQKAQQKQLREAGLEIKASCGVDFDERLRRVLESYPSDIGALGPSRRASVLTLRQDANAKQICSGELKRPDGSSIYRFQAFTSTPSGLTDAGGDTAAELVNLYAGYACEALAGPVPPPTVADQPALPMQVTTQLPRRLASPLRPRPPWGRGLLLSGLRQLEYSNWEQGWWWTVGESALLVSGIAFTALSVVQRNQPLDSGVDRARTYQKISYASFGAILPLRIVATVAF